MHLEAELKGLPLLEGHLHLPLLGSPTSVLLRVANHIPSLFKSRVEVESNVLVTEASLQVHSKPRQRETKDFSAAWLLPTSERKGLAPLTSLHITCTAYMNLLASFSVVIVHLIWT